MAASKDYTQQIPLLAHKRGDKWPGIASIGPVIINGSQPAATLARIRMHFKKDTLVYKFDTDATDRDAPITISNATTWEATVPEDNTGNFCNEAGEWAWDMEFYETGSAAPLTLYKGIICVNPDTTT